ncbi:MAG: hypothetical protein A4E23_00470 [Methanomethylovorans sp. PtaU1.Bin073]|nr:MAG: hypothetical protein A4E23_00470 [Methanomethylovorans sp. PtaU1.Bin073]
MPSPLRLATPARTSYTLMPIASQYRASWLTAAICKSLKVFSAVLVTSAAVAVMGITLPLVSTGVYNSTARLVHTSSIPPTILSCSLMFCNSLPTITLSGAWASAKSSPATRPDSFSRISLAIPTVVPGVIVDSSTTSIPFLRFLPTFVMPSMSALKSGDRLFGSSKGVWIANVTASSSLIFEKSDVQVNLPAFVTFFNRSSSPGSSPLRGLSPLLSISIL